MATDYPKRLTPDERTAFLILIQAQMNAIRKHADNVDAAVDQLAADLKLTTNGVKTGILKEADHGDNSSIQFVKGIAQNETKPTEPTEGC